MLRKVCNVFSYNNVKTIKKSFRDIKNNSKSFPQNIYQSQGTRIESKKIINNKDIENIFNKVIYDEIYMFNNYNNLTLDKSYLLWSLSDNKRIEYNYCFNTIIAVISDKPVFFEFYISNNKQANVLKKNDILIYNGDLPIKFYNHKASDLAFFHCKYKQEINKK